VKFTISKRALRQVEKIARWWVAHRPAAPSMFMDELGTAERLLRGHPEAGIAYATHRTGVIRRILLGGTKHHLYYRYHADRDELLVLSVWGAPRERGPKL
jgi:plasmid stabilization system protein ParE